MNSGRKTTPSKLPSKASRKHSKALADESGDSEVGLPVSFRSIRFHSSRLSIVYTHRRIYPITLIFKRLACLYYTGYGHLWWVLTLNLRVGTICIRSSKTGMTPMCLSQSAAFCFTNMNSAPYLHSQTTDHSRLSGTDVSLFLWMACISYPSQ